MGPFATAVGGAAVLSVWVGVISLAYQLTESEWWAGMCSAVLIGFLGALEFYLLAYHDPRPLYDLDRLVLAVTGCRLTRMPLMVAMSVISAPVAWVIVVIIRSGILWR
jgi:hypothetical protein